MSVRSLKVISLPVILTLFFARTRMGEAFRSILEIMIYKVEKEKKKVLGKELLLGGDELQKLLNAKQKNIRTAISGRSRTRAFFCC